MKQLIIVGFLVIMRLHPAAATEPLGAELAKSFVGACLQALPDIKKVEAAARVMKWKELDGDEARMMAPQAPDAKWKAWLINQAPAPPYFLAISQAKLSEGNMVSCTIFNPYAPVSEVLPHLEKILLLQAPTTDETSSGQRSRIWEIQINGSPGFLSLIDATPVGETGLNITAAMQAASSGN